MKHFIKYSLIFISNLGCNPYKPNKILSLPIVLNFFTVCMQLVFSLFFDWKGMISLNTFTDFVIIFQIYCKLLTMKINRRKLANILIQLDYFWDSSNKIRQKLEIDMEESRKLMKLFIGNLTCVYILMGGLYVMKPYLLGTKTLPVESYLFVINVTKNPTYEILYAQQTFGTVWSVLISLGFDILFVSLIWRIVWEFKFLKAGFLNVHVDPTSWGDDEENLQELKTLVIHHNFILRYVHDLEEFYTILFLVHFSTSIFSICGALIILNFESFSTNFSLMFMYMVYLMVFTSQLFIYCFAGSYLVYESQSVADAIFEIDWWIKTQPKLRYGLLLAILRAQRPAKLTAGGMFNLDLESFASIIKTGLSFFTVIRTMFSR